jgi:uncharacterized protein (DUF58 family)
MSEAAARSELHATQAWALTPSARRGLLVGALCLALGVITRRPALVLLGAPLLLVTLPAVAGDRRGAGGAARWWVQAGPAPEGDGRSLAVHTVAVLPDRAEVVVLRLTEPAGLRVRAVGRPPGGVLRHTAVITPTGWGPLRLAQVDLMLADALGLLSTGPVAGPVLSTVVLPDRDPGTRDALRPAPLRVAGRHRRRVPGHSAEPFDLRGYRPGDPLRWVDARASSRRRARSFPGAPPVEDLVVRRRIAEADADLVLLLDARADVVAELSGWARLRDLSQHPRHPAETGYRAGTAADGGTLDAVTRLGSALAAAYLEAGDRVGVANLADPRRGLLTVGGPGQLPRVEHLLAGLQPDRNLLFRPGALLPAFEPVLDRIPPHASVVLLGPLLDDDMVALGLHVLRRGHLLAVADLTPQLVPEPTPASRTATLLVAVEHRRRVARLQAGGAAVVPPDPYRLALALAGGAGRTGPVSGPAAVTR